MIQKISILILVLSLQFSFAQKAQKIGYIDRDYILENVPEYTAGQSKLDSRIKTWNAKLDKFQKEIKNLKATLVNEKALLTKDLIAEREEDIVIKETELKRLQEAYYGVSGDLFMLRKQLISPVQDQIFNAIQEISKAKKYDLIFDKSSKDMVMLYSNPKYDISELVLQKIVKGRKVKANAKKRSDKEIERENKKEAVKDKIKERRTKKEILQDKIRKQKEDRAAKRVAVKKANEEKRAKKLAEIKARRENVKSSKKPKTKNTKKEDSEIGKELETKKSNSSKKDVGLTKEEQRIAKRKKLEDRLKLKKAKREAAQIIIKEKRAKRIAEIEARKKSTKITKKPVTKITEEKGESIDVKAKKENKGEEETPKKMLKEESSKEKLNLGTKDAIQTKEEQRAAKIKALKNRQTVKKAKRDSLQKVAKEKRAKKLAAIKARREKLKNSKNN